MAVNSTSHSFGHHEADPWAILHSVTFTDEIASGMDDEIRLHRSNTVLDGGAELCRPSHPVLSREHATRP